jgi:two-component system, response regulator PdtaR
MDGDELNSTAAILVVEDESLIRFWVAELLEENGFSVLMAADADTALILLESRPDVDLLFTDVQMPGSLNGMELARVVHARWPNILLMLTSGRERPTRTEMPEDGRFVAKPYSAQELIGQVNDLLHKA